MDGFQLHLPGRTSFVFLLLILLQSATGEICSGPKYVQVAENNTLGYVVATIFAEPDVTLELSPESANAFLLEGKQLLAAKVFDYEIQKDYNAKITCTKTTTNAKMQITIIVLVDNVNDNPPVFGQNTYHIDVNEMSPVGTSVGRFEAIDRDNPSQLFYTLTSESNSFKLQSSTDPNLLTAKILDYDKVKNIKLTLYAQDTPLTGSVLRNSFTATTTIMVTILDVDNRPPWFQPCVKHEIGMAVICESFGYTGSVVLNEQETGALPLKPGPLYAIDGDSGINDTIRYSILSGNMGNLFEINADTGKISMLKPATSLTTIHLKVLAVQSRNSNQFDTTTVTISVLVKSHHPPQFQKPLYSGVITNIGSMALDDGKPLSILATDADYPDGLNPLIEYSINGSSDFSIIGGYLFMTKDLPDTTLHLQVVATDMSNDESAAAQLTVEVKSGLTTTIVPVKPTNTMTTTPMRESTTISKTTGGIVSTHTLPVKPTNTMTTTPMRESTTISKTTGGIVSTHTLPVKPTNTMTTTPMREPTTNSKTTGGIVSTTKPSPSTGNSISTRITTSESIKSTTKSSMPTATANSGLPSNPSMTSEGSVSTSRTAHPPTVIMPSGGYGPEDMAALGATLGVLLFVCLVIIAVLLYRTRKEKADWRKIYEVNLFRGSLGQSTGGHKEGIQYTNEAFQNDEDGGSMCSSGPGGEIQIVDRKAIEDAPFRKAMMTSLPPPHALFPDDTSQVGSETADNGKEVKPILTKERRMEEGYKAVWFKEDIDPNAKEEVVIIPDNRGDESEEDEEGPNNKNPEADSDLDSGLGVKMDPPEASDSDKAQTSEL